MHCMIRNCIAPATTITTKSPQSTDMYVHRCILALRGQQRVDPQVLLVAEGTREVRDDALSLARRTGISWEEGEDEEAI